MLLTDRICLKKLTVRLILPHHSMLSKKERLLVDSITLNLNFEHPK